MRKRTSQPNDRPTLSDVARRAEVSLSTASLVLAGKAKERYISDEVIVRVQQAARFLDYSPNLLVRSMQRGRTSIFAFYSGFRHDRADCDLYTSRLMTGLERAIGRKGLNLLTYCAYQHSPEETYRYLAGGHSDGVLFFCPREDDPLLPFFRSSRLPVIILNGEDPEGQISSVSDDIDDGMRQVADALLAQGHRRVGALSCPPAENPDGHQRVERLRALMAAGGAPIPPEYVREADYNPGSLETAFAGLMDLPEPPTALFCWQDLPAYQVIELCGAHGISVPDQLSIVGYDGVRWPARTDHTVASIVVAIEEIAARAVEMLNDLVTKKQAAPLRAKQPVSFIPGTTLAPPHA